MNYGTFGIVSDYSGLLSGLNSFNKASINTTSPPRKIFFNNRNNSFAYKVNYSSYIDRILVIQFGNNQTSDIYIVNPNNNTIENILLSPTADLGGVSIESVGNKAFITYYNTNFFKVLDLDTLTFTSDRISTNGSFTYSIKYSNLTNNLYLANYGTNNVTVFDKSTLTLSATISSTANPVDILPVDDINRLFISGYGNNCLYVYNLTTLSLISTIGGISGCYGTNYCPSNNCLYIASYHGASVRVLNCNTNTIVATISIPSSYPLDVKYNPNNGFIYVTSPDVDFKGIAIINPSTNTIIDYYREVVQPYFLSFCPTNNRMYFTQYTANNLIQL